VGTAGAVDYGAGERTHKVEDIMLKADTARSDRFGVWIAQDVGRSRTRNSPSGVSGARRRRAVKTAQEALPQRFTALAQAYTV